MFRRIETERIEQWGPKRDESYLGARQVVKVLGVQINSVRFFVVKNIFILKQNELTD